MIQKELILKTLFALVLTLAFLYLVLPLFLRRSLKVKKGKLASVEEAIALGKDVYLVSLRVKDRRFFVILSPNFAKVLYEEELKDGEAPERS
ncbi:MAG: hypothetical protein GXO04_05385 [Aquificae bacterium]|nr:hypothetical protein [Aquificota bacterium]